MRRALLPNDLRPYIWRERNSDNAAIAHTAREEVAGERGRRWRKYTVGPREILIPS